MTLTTLVTGVRSAAREAAIAATVDPAISTALILEGIAPDLGRLGLHGAPDTLQITRIAPGCMCCVGNLTLRVTLNRVLRDPPQRLFISLATTSHIAQIRTFLTSEPYNTLLALTDEMSCDSVLDAN